MQPEFDYLAREVVREAAQAYVSPSFDTSNPPDIDGMCEARGLRLMEDDFVKITRYAIAAAGIHLLTQEAVIGTGPTALFADGRREMVTERHPQIALQMNIEANMMLAAERLHKPEASLFGYLMQRYETESMRDSTNFHTGSASFIESGGTLDHNGAEFVRLSSAVLLADPKTEARTMDTLSRVVIAHKLIPTVTGKASRHLFSGSDIPVWKSYDAGNVLLAQRADSYAMRRGDSDAETGHRKGSALFRVPPSVMKAIRRGGPLIKCPAHQLLFSDETALQTAMHAVVNLGYERRWYGYDLAA